MEGNDCYKFSTVNRYLATTEGKPVRTVVDVGCSVPEEMKRRFAEARIFSFEAVPEHYRTSAKRVAPNLRLTVVNATVCGYRIPAGDWVGLGMHGKPAVHRVVFRCRQVSGVRRLA